MADDFDVEAMLEAPFRKDEIRSSHANGHDGQNKKKRRSRSKSRSPGSKKKRSRSRDKKKSKKRSKSRERKRTRSKERHRSGSRSKERSGRYRARKSPVRKRSKSRSPFKKEKSPIRNFEDAIGQYNKIREQPIDNLTPEERDARTVFCMQLAARIRARDLEDFFSAVGKVRDVRMISDRNSRRSKGIAYIEFVESSSVPLAIGLTGQRLLGVPIIVQASQAEKNRAAAAANNLQKGSSGPMRLYVGSLHFNITEEMLRGIFEPFGKIEGIQLMMDSETGRSKGYGFISFSDAECAKKALEQLNGFELAGRPMKVGHVTERSDSSTASSFLDNDELERTGIDLGTTGRLQLMARLAEGTGLKIPPAAQQALQMTGSIPFGNISQQSVHSQAQNQALNLPSQPLATHCLQLSNLFNPQAENDLTWAAEIQDDVIEECNKHGGIVHIYVDRNSAQGNVYVKCPSIPAAMATVNALHGRWFAGKMITAAYVPLPTYHNLFPDSVTAKQLLMPTRR
ncbi:RNA-binding protein 39-like isoform X1 [Trematomus bernacchii]|uniref:RNA-binding protein 39-like isoform X1 n=2 Tax=Trematomus bernacchii TaxID=40690 RepID=UPI00146C2487|nr:RNA-binding protein 39-like isoform X1 [Trematomus bernacchii]XP_033982393.1 RNA-binding protein 39-like isoform X1 [Trematomus bernacchii]XP_033982394.1 RNA-binding protein 39-like isoform X1 [Trematomus bernacchii]